jgi:hypothetical protein
MLDWISDTILAVVNFFPALIVDKSDPNFELIRVMLALLLIVLTLYIIAMLPSRVTLARRTGELMSRILGRGGER